MDENFAQQEAVMETHVRFVRNVFPKEKKRLNIKNLELK